MYEIKRLKLWNIYGRIPMAMPFSPQQTESERWFNLNPSCTLLSS
jgi:hypothetical protein